MVPKKPLLKRLIDLLLMETRLPHRVRAAHPSILQQRFGVMASSKSVAVMRIRWQRQLPVRYRLASVHGSNLRATTDQFLMCPFARLALLQVQS